MFRILGEIFSTVLGSKSLISLNLPLLCVPIKILLIWFQRPIIPGDGVSGLFNNQNHAGSWLVIILPFLIACMYQISNSKLEIQNLKLDFNGEISCEF